MKKNLFFIAIAVLAVSGCVKQKFRYDAFLELSAVSHPVVPAGTPDTPVDLPAGTEIGVYAPSETETLVSTPRANIPYTVAADGSLIGEQMMLRMGSSYDLYGYSPRRAVVPDPSAVEFFHGEDLLWAHTVLDNISSGAVSAQLVFEHKMSQVDFDIIYVDETPDDVEFEVTGFYNNCFLDISTGEITLGTTTDATITQTDTPVSFITPEGSNLLLRITVTVPGEVDPVVFSGTIVQTFDPNTSYVITVNVDIAKTEVLISGAVVPWVDGGNQTEIIE